MAILTSSVSFPPLRGGGPRTAQSTVVFPRTVRLLLTTSYRNAEDEGPGSSSYVSRVDDAHRGKRPVDRRDVSTLAAVMPNAHNQATLGAEATCDACQRSRRAI